MIPLLTRRAIPFPATSLLGWTPCLVARSVRPGYASVEPARIGDATTPPCRWAKPVRRAVGCAADAAWNSVGPCQSSASASLARTRATVAGSAVGRLSRGPGEPAGGGAAADPGGLDADGRVGCVCQTSGGAPAGPTGTGASLPCLIVKSGDRGGTGYCPGRSCVRQDSARAQESWFVATCSFGCDSGAVISAARRLDGVLV
jgi:hypothetical protein